MYTTFFNRGKIFNQKPVCTKHRLEVRAVKCSFIKDDFFSPLNARATSYSNQLFFPPSGNCSELAFTVKPDLYPSAKRRDFIYEGYSVIHIIVFLFGQVTRK